MCLWRVAPSCRHPCVCRPRFTAKLQRGTCQSLQGTIITRTRCHHIACCRSGAASLGVRAPNRHPTHQERLKHTALVLPGLGLKASAHRLPERCLGTGRRGGLFPAWDDPGWRFGGFVGRVWTSMPVTGGFGMVLQHPLRKVCEEDWVDAVDGGAFVKALQTANPGKKKGPWKVLCDNESFLRAKHSRSAHRRCKIHLVKIPASSPDFQGFRGRCGIPRAMLPRTPL